MEALEVVVVFVVVIADDEVEDARRVDEKKGAADVSFGLIATFGGPRYQGVRPNSFLHIKAWWEIGENEP